MRVPWRTSGITGSDALSLLTMVSIQLIPPLVAVVGWRWAFPVLALGPMFGIASIRRLVGFRAARTAA